MLRALNRLVAGGELMVPVVGVGVTELDTDGLGRHIADGVRASGGVDPAELEKMLGLVHPVSGDYADPGDVFAALADAVAAEAGPDAFAVHYLAVPPSLFGTVADGTVAAGLGRARAWWSRSRSATTWCRPAPSMPGLAAITPRTGCSVSTTSWARSRSRTCWYAVRGTP